MALRPLEPESMGLFFVSGLNGIGSKALTATKESQEQAFW